MKKLLAILLCLSQPSWATWSVVQAKTNAGGGSPCAVTMTSISAGNTLAVSIKGGTGSVQPITAVSSTGDSWSSPAISMSVADTSSGFLDMWYLLSAAGGETSISITSTVNTTTCFAWELHSTVGTGQFDTAGTRDQNTGTGTPAGVTLTLTGSNDAIIQNIQPGGTVTAINGTFFSPAGIAIGQGISASTNTATGAAPTWTQTAGNNATLDGLAIKEPGGATIPGSNKAMRLERDE